MTPELFDSIKKLYVMTLQKWVDAKRHYDHDAEGRYWKVILSLEAAYPNAIQIIEAELLKSGGIDKSKPVPEP